MWIESMDPSYKVDELRFQGLETHIQAHIPPETALLLVTQCEEKVHKQAEIDMPIANPNVRGTQHDHIPPLMLGLMLGLRGDALGLRGFLNTNLLVSATRNAHVGVQTNATP